MRCITTSNQHSPRACSCLFSADRAARLKAGLDTLYARFNRPEWIDPDPLAVALEYPEKADCEVAALVAALLAFGRVRQIMTAARKALSAWPRLHEGLLNANIREIRRASADFRHRYAGPEDLAGLLHGIAQALREHGSLERAFSALRKPEDADILPALTRFAANLRGNASGTSNYLLPNPALGGACKRWFLFLRWMARRDRVDPGLWQCVHPKELLVPLDTHMHRIGRALGFTGRNTADIRTAKEITAGFATLRPNDPVRYDFSLTRAALHDAPALAGLLAEQT